MAVDAHPMRSVEDILEIVDCIYAAACSETSWERTIGEVTRGGQLSGCALSAVDARERRRGVLAAYGLGAGGGAPRGQLSDDPPLLESVIGARPGVVWQDTQIVGEAGRARFRAWLKARGFASSVWVALGRDERHVVFLEGYAGPGLGANAPGDFLRLLAPHLVRAWRLGGSSLAAVCQVGSPSSDTEALSASDLAALPEAARLRAAFGLTKAEARLALRLAEGASLASAAAAFDVKLTTIRSQLQQVFAKTGTSRQTELVALLLSCGYVARRPPWRRAQAVSAEVGA